MRLPRARRPASYSAQLVTLWRCLGMRCRRSALALKGMAGVPHGSRDRPCASLLQGARSGDPCNKMHLVENFFAKLKQFRAIATCHDKTARNSLGAIHLAAAYAWLI